MTMTMTAPRSPIDKAIAARNAPGQQHRQYNAEVRLRDVDPPPPDFDPRAIVGASHDADNARSGMDSLYSAWAQIAETAANPDVNLQELGRVATQALERSLRTVDRTLECLVASERRIQSEIDAAIQPQLTDTAAAELRTVLRERRPAEVVTAAAADARVASAVLSGPAIITGLDARQIETLRTAAIEAHAPDQAAQLAEVARARAKVEAGRDRAIQKLAPRITAWANPDPEALTKLRTMA